MSYSFVDALQMGGASATIMGIMILSYKAITLLINHRLRSDCCGRWCLIGVVAEEVPPDERHTALVVHD